jgi:hypothetical protein
MQFPCNPLVEDYPEVFYAIHRGDAPSFQCEVNLRWSKSMREVDGLSFSVIDFNVLMLAPRLSWIEAALQLSENITLCAIRGVHTVVISKEGQINTWCLGVSYIYCTMLGTWRNLEAPLLSKVKVKVRVTLRLAVYRQSVCLGVKPLETHDQNFFPPTEPFRY